MARDWHEIFKSWAKPPSDTEETKGSRAAKMIKEAVRETGILEGRSFDVYPTGSYPNNTNIRLGSDVDVALVLRDAFFFDLPVGHQREAYGLTSPATYGFVDFRRDVGKALTAKFGSDVEPGNKTFDIAGNSSRLPADATPFLRYRLYTGRLSPDGSWHYYEGVKSIPRKKGSLPIINWHQEHYDNGVTKNSATNRRYKRVARILKRLRNDMKDSGSTDAKAAAEPVPSFLLECLAYNAADSCFNQVEGSYFEDVKSVISAAWNMTKPERATSLLEVNERKLLFGEHQGWSRDQAHTFMLQAWRHVGFE